VFARNSVTAIELYLSRVVIVRNLSFFFKVFRNFCPSSTIIFCKFWKFS